MFDVSIIGTGAAGISAALTLNNLKKNFIWFGSPELSEKIRKAERIRNYPGLSMVDGKTFADAMKRQIAEAGITITDKTVTSVLNMGDSFCVLCNREVFRAKTVLLTTGVESTSPIPGELEFVGRGVSYCATCDGLIYQGKTIAVVCTTKELEHEIEYLAGIAAHVILVALYRDPQIKSENVTVLRGKSEKILGEGHAQQIVISGQTYDVDGVFMLKQAVTPSVLVPGLQVENGHIVVSRQMETSMKGCFAAGDCTGRPYQYTKATGEGNIAAHSIAAYLTK